MPEAHLNITDFLYAISNPVGYSGARQIDSGAAHVENCVQCESSSAKANPEAADNHPEPTSPKNSEEGGADEQQ